MARPANVPARLRRTPFRGSVAIDAGLITEAGLRSGFWRRLFHDVYVHAAVADCHLLRIRAASLLLPPGAVITGRSAPHVWGAELARAGDPVEVLTPRRMRVRCGLAIRVGTSMPARPRCFEVSR